MAQCSVYFCKLVLIITHINLHIPVKGVCGEIGVPSSFAFSSDELPTGADPYSQQSIFNNYINN